MLELLGFSLFALAIGAAGVIAGIALLRMWAFARAINLLYAALSILHSLLWFLFPIHSAAPDASLSGQTIGKVLSLCLGLAYPIILLILFQRPSWIAALGARRGS